MDERYEIPGALVHDRTVAVPLHRGADDGAAHRGLRPRAGGPGQAGPRTCRAGLPAGRPGRRSPRGRPRRRLARPRAAGLPRRPARPARHRPQHPRHRRRRVRRSPTPRPRPTTCSHFRADSIVADAEHIRRHALGGRPLDDARARATAASSRSPTCPARREGLRRLLHHRRAARLDADAPTSVYRAHLSPGGRAKVRRFYARYPADVGARRARSPTGCAATTSCSRTATVLTGAPAADLGMCLGDERRRRELHWLLEEAWTTATERLSDMFLDQVAGRPPSSDNPLYAALHEAIYAPGAARRVGRARPSGGPEFDADAGRCCSPAR